MVSGMKIGKKKEAYKIKITYARDLYETNHRTRMPQRRTGKSEPENEGMKVKKIERK